VRVDLSRTRLPKALWVLWAGFFGIMLGYSVLVPLIRSPDERLHTDLILAVEEGRYDWNPYDGVMTERGEEANAALGSWIQPKTVDNAVPRGQRPTLDELGGVEPGERANWQRQHPPLYYAVVGTVANVLTDDGQRIDRHVWLLRVLDAVLASLLVPLGYLAAGAVTERTALRVAAAASLAAIPQLAHIGASVNNDNLANVLAAATLVVALRIARYGASRRRLVAVGVVLGLTFLTKSVAVVLLPSVALAIAGRRRAGEPWRDVAEQVGLVGGVAFLVGGWWWLRNLVVHGTFLPSDYDPVLEPGAGPPPTFTWLRAFVDRVDRSFWGELGSLETEIPWWVAWPATVLVGVVVFAALQRPDVRRLVLVALAPMATALVLLLGMTWRGIAVDGRVPGLQGRYLFVGIVGLVVAVAATLDGLDARWLRRAGWLLGGTILALHAAAVHAALQWFYGGPTLGLADQLRGLLAWSPAGNAATVAVLAAGAIGVVACAVVAVTACAGAAQRAASAECQFHAEPMISSRPRDGSQPRVVRTSELSE
jgi:hypothetical protein